MQKLRFAHFKIVLENLEQIFIEQKQADKVIPLSIKKPAFGSKDRKFIASTSYDIVRWWKLLYENYSDFCIPKRNELEKVVYNYFVFKDFDIPEWEEFKKFNSENLNKRISSNDFGVTSSTPDWLVDKVKKSYPSNYEDLINNLNNQAEVIIRVNTLKTNTEKLQSILEREGIETSTITEYPNSLLIKGRKKLTALKSFQQGLFEIHDLGSQDIAPLLDPKPNELVIDACSGAGGKSLHLAELMNNQGKVISMDIYDFKLKELQKRAKRNGINIISTETIKGKKTISKHFSSADKLLLDVPCSGTGVLKRSPDSKWKLTPEFIEEIKSTQAHIIREYSKMLKPNGLMVYATCSILPEENEEQVQSFLEEHKNYSLIKEEYHLPTDPLSDGYYMALISKS